jgi:hypothetical protein
MEDNNITNTTNKLPTLEVEQTSDIDKLISDDIEILNSDELTESVEKAGFLNLPHGQALRLAETYSITASEDSKMIVLIGPFDSGKTTIETTIYQLFQRKPFCGLYFAGSNSLFGYEERSFYTRLTSKKEMATTPRTSRFDDKIFLHLKLFNCLTKTKTNYLFADISGEEIYSHLGNVETLTQNMPYLRSTHNYTFVLDGKQLSDKNQRNGVIDEIYTMARTIFDAQLFTSRTRVQIVISKYDLIKGNDDINLEDTIDKRIQCIVDLSKKYISEVSIHKIAAMPQNNHFEIGFGMDKLLNTWNKNYSNIQISQSYAINCELKSEFNKLIYKLSGGEVYG